MSARPHHVMPATILPTLEGRLARAVLSGFAATFVMLVAFVVAYSASRLIAARLAAEGPLAGAIPIWLHNLTHNPLVDAGRTDVFVATAVYLLGGLFWAILYATLFEPRLKGPGWYRGLLFAGIPALLSVTVYLPLVGGGFLGSAFDAGPLPTLGNFILHAVYGIVLGHLYGPFGSLDSTTLGARGIADSRTQRGTEVMAARGLVVGLFVGLGVGILAAILTGTPFNGHLAGQPVAAILLASTGIGAACGSAAGSFAGLEGHHDLPTVR
jgi:hypothetical protein